MTYSFLAPAQRELEEAVNFYDDLRPGLGAQFAGEVENAIHRILQNPQVWPKLSRAVRRCRLRRFPYGIVYQFRQDHVLIVAVMHLRRQADYWRDRMDL